MGGASLKINDDGSFNLLIGATDLGTGADTILAQIAAEVLGVPTAQVVVYAADTDMTPFDVGAYASSTTYVSGMAVKKSADEVARQIRTRAAIMLDIQGFVSETNDTNLFLVSKGVVRTPHADACLPGLTRAMVLDICRANGIPAEERNLSLTEFYTAEEVFTSGTMGELTPVLEADGRQIGDGTVGKMTRRLQTLHREYAWKNGTPLPF